MRISDNVSIGSTSNSSSAPLSTRFELHRPFAAHCIGFPVVTLGFRVKSLFSKWRMRIRREEVMRRNEFFEKLLADAVPTSYEDRHHFTSSSRRYLMLKQDASEQQDSTYPDGASDGATGRYYSSASSSCTSNGQTLAICGSTGQVSTASVTSGVNHLSKRITQKMFSKSVTGQRQPNGQICGSSASSTSGVAFVSVVQRRNGSLATPPLSSSKAGLLSDAGDNANSTVGSHRSSSSSIISYASQNLLYKLGRIIIVARLLQLLGAIAYSAVSVGYRRLIRPMSLIARQALFGGNSVTSLTASDQVESDYQNGVTSPLNQIDGSWNLSGSQNHQQQSDDLISCSGDGSSHVGGPDESDKEERLSQYTTCSGANQSVVAGAACTNSSVTAGNKRKSRRTRGRTPVVESSDDVVYGPPVAAAHQNGYSRALTDTKATVPSPNLCNGQNYSSGMDAEKYFACNGNAETENSTHGARENHSSGSSKSVEARQLQKEKEILESSVEKLTNELKTTRSHVHELRTQLSQTQQNERIYKNELLQHRTKFDHLEMRHKNLLKQSDQAKVLVASYEKRLNDLQARKAELEQELANEQRVVANAVSTKEKHGNFAHMKSKVQELERETKNLRRQINVKDEEREKIVAELYELRCSNFTQQNEGKSLWERVSTLIERNAFLEKTLSSENRLKQDLFQALNNSKAEIALLKERLQGFENGGDLAHVGNDGGLNNGAGLLDFVSQPDDYHAFNTIAIHDQAFGTAQQQFGGLAQRQNSSPLAGGGALLRPVSPIAVANLEQLMQATGAQHMSYSFAPYEAALNDEPEMISSPKSDASRNGGFNKVATDSCAVGSSRKRTSAKSGGNNGNAKKSVTSSHRGSNGGDSCASDGNGDAKGGKPESADEANYSNVSLSSKQKLQQQSSSKAQPKSSVTIAN